MGAVQTDVHVDDQGEECQGLGLTRQAAPRKRYQVSLESPDDGLSEDDAAGEGYIPLPKEMGPSQLPPWYQDTCRGGERLS